MKKNLTELVFILDRSGSMAGLEDDTIGGFNAMIEKQKRESGEALVSTVLFDNDCEVIHDRVNIRKIEPMTRKEYYVRGCTALLDAVGGAIHHIGNVHKYAREEDRPEKTLFVITTDGKENAARFGIGADRAANYHADREGTHVIYETVSEAITQVRCCAALLSANWKQRVDEDYKKRGK